MEIELFEPTELTVQERAVTQAYDMTIEQALARLSAVQWKL